MNSTFESCLGRYGGAALFLCGGRIIDSTFASNEAEGLFGAVVNGDLSDEERLNASIALSTPNGQSFTCSALRVSGTIFEENFSGNGYGGAIASVDAGLSVFNSTMVETVGGALYFGTADDTGRDQLKVSVEWYGRGGAGVDRFNLRVVCMPFWTLTLFPKCVVSTHERAYELHGSRWTHGSGDALDGRCYTSRHARVPEERRLDDRDCEHVPREGGEG